MSKLKYIIPIFVPHKGCPHDCIFCNQKKITGQLGEIDDVDVIIKIKEYLKTIPAENTITEVAFYGGSFTAIPLEQQERLLSAAYKYVRTGEVEGIRISTRPDCINREILDNLKKYGVDTIELGVQSMDMEVLEASRRGHTREDVIKAAGLIHEYGFVLGLQMMVGLPGDNREISIRTAKEIIALKPQLVRIYPALVIKNTYMEELYLSGRYEPLKLDAAVEICKTLLILFERNNINVIRIGLQPTENIIPGKDVAAGPFHPSMRQLVESMIYRDMLGYLIEINRLQEKDIEIIVNPRDVSDIIGQKKSNIRYIRDKFNMKKIRIVQWNNVERHSIMTKFVDNERILSKKDYYDLVNI
ncbi:MAG: elongator complex protein 3 [Bacillota bacterium]